MLLNNYWPHWKRVFVQAKRFIKKLFDWKPYNLAVKLKIVAEAEAVENNSEIAGEYGISELMVPSLEER